MPSNELSGACDSSDGKLDPNCSVAAAVAIMISEPEGLTVVKPGYDSKDAGGGEDEKAAVVSRCESDREQCRVCQVQTEEPLMDLGCKCRGELARAHKSCIETWFRSRGSSKCEICQQFTIVPSPVSRPSRDDWVWGVDSVHGSAIVLRREHERRCFNPLWAAFVILIGGLSLDVMISISLGVSALPVNIIIGLLIVTGLGTVARIALESCCVNDARRRIQSSQTAINPVHRTPV